MNESLDRLGQLDDSLGEFKASDPCPWQIGQIYNALLEQAKQQYADDPVVAVLEPLREQSGGGWVAGPSTGAIRAAVKQLLAIVD